MNYTWVETCAAEFPVSRVCEVLGVSESGYYAWKDRAPSPRETENHTLGTRIQEIWQRFRQCYGAPRVHAELQAQGYRVSKNRVARLMRRLGICGKGRKKRKPHTTQADHSHEPAPNVLDRQFSAERPDQVWLTDITYIETREGFLYTAGVMDLCTRQIVGLAMADHLRAELTETALQMALIQRQPNAELLHHSDRGSQYTCATYQQLLAKETITVSMSRTGNCLDNAPMESFWATLKRECADRVFDSLNHAKSEIFSYIMGFYNRFRRHSALDYLSPHEYELQLLRQTPTPSN